MKLSFVKTQEGNAFYLRMGIITMQDEEFFWEHLPDQSSTKLFSNKYAGISFQKRMPFENQPIEGLVIKDLLTGITATAPDPILLKNLSEDLEARLNELSEDARFRKYYGRDDAPDEWCLPEQSIDLKHP